MDEGSAHTATVGLQSPTECNALSADAGLAYVDLVIGTTLRARTAESCHFVSGNHRRQHCAAFAERVGASELHTSPQGAVVLEKQSPCHLGRIHVIQWLVQSPTQLQFNLREAEGLVPCLALSNQLIMVADFIQ